jgi:hypothetical protein
VVENSFDDMQKAHHKKLIKNPSVLFIVPTKQGCHMVCFQTKNPNLGKFWMFLQWKILVYFSGHLVHFHTILYILLHNAIFCGHLVYLARFSILCPAKSGNPGRRPLN